MPSSELSLMYMKLDFDVAIILSTSIVSRFCEIAYAIVHFSNLFDYLPTLKFRRVEIRSSYDR